MSNGTRRTVASGLQFSAGSNVSKRYKALHRKLGAVGNAPGSLLQAAQQSGRKVGGNGYNGASAIRNGLRTQNTRRQDASAVASAMRNSAMRNTAPRRSVANQIGRVAGAVARPIVRGARDFARGVLGRKRVKRKAISTGNPLRGDYIPNRPKLKRKSVKRKAPSMPMKIGSGPKGPMTGLNAGARSNVRRYKKLHSMPSQDEVADFNARTHTKSVKKKQ